MSEERSRKPPKSRVKKRPSSFLYLAVAIIAACIIGFYFYERQHSQQQELLPAEAPPTGEATPASSPQATVTPEEPGGQQVVSPLPPDADVPAAGDGAMAIDNKEGMKRQSDTSSVFLMPGEVSKPAAKKEDQQLIDRLNGFYQHLDKQPYMQTFQLQEPSRVHFSKLIQKLLDNPPVVTRETDDLFTLLKNTAHFFRILGKDNIIILKGILDREKESFEEVLKTFYQLTFHPKSLEQEYGLSLPFAALYDYAGFFLNTMGGRLYLFRRDSNSRMVVSYYAIMIVDRANNEGTGYHGIDIRPAIDFLINEIESGGTRLQLREQYLDTLYDLKEKYNFYSQSN